MHNEVDISFTKLIHPFCAILSGPTQCGKTEWTRKLIHCKNEVIEPPPQKVIWIYKIWQPAYDGLSRNYDVEFVQGLQIPENNSGIPTLLIIDDFMADLNEKLLEIFLWEVII